MFYFLSAESTILHRVASSSYHAEALCISTNLDRSHTLKRICILAGINVVGSFLLTDSQSILKRQGRVDALSDLKASYIISDVIRRERLGESKFLYVSDELNLSDVLTKAASPKYKRQMINRILTRGVIKGVLFKEAPKSLCKNIISKMNLEQ